MKISQNFSLDIVYLKSSTEISAFTTVRHSTEQVAITIQSHQNHYFASFKPKHYSDRQLFKP